MTLTELGAVAIFRGGREVGLRFCCPYSDGAGPHPEGHAICALYANPPDGGPAHPDDPACPGNNGGRRWTRYGTGIADLTLSPSVDCSSVTGSTCRYHGVVVGGRP